MDTKFTEPKVIVKSYCPENPSPQLPLSLHTPLASTSTLPPYIFYLETDGLPDSYQPMTLDHFITKFTLIPAPYVRELLQIGAVYLRMGHPHPRRSPRPKRQSLSVATMTPLPTDTPLFIRLYAIPKRHVAYTPFTIIEKNKTFIAVCKPAGIPVAPSVDNIVDCLLTLTTRAVQADQLYITTRLDVPTSGIVLLATTARNAGIVNRALAFASKSYLAWTVDKPRQGVLSHWYNNAASRRRGPLRTPLIATWAPYAPGGAQTSADNLVKWVEARLVITHVVRVGAAWRSHVQLITGRTHQIRMQFAAEGWPLLGDCKYAPAAGRMLHPAPSNVELGKDPDCLCLHAEALHVSVNEVSYTLHVPMALRGTHGLPTLG